VVEGSYARGVDRGGRMTRWVFGLWVLIVAPIWAAGPAGNDDATTPSAADGSGGWSYQLYVDAGYAAADNDPANRTWRSKATTFELDDARLFLGMGQVRKEATPGSRWGVEFGLQTGVDSEGLVPGAPPPAEEPVADADGLRHLYRANASYRFGSDRGVQLTGGLINSFIGYESYLAIDNPNYTRAYITDMAPYFLVGFEALWSVSDQVDLSFYLVTGYNYLANPNNVPSAGFQATWQVSPRLSVTQNLYYGPDQAQTSVAFWRLLTDTHVEWTTGRFLVAAAVDFGSEKQARLPGQPTHRWSSAALWARWNVGKRWSLALRPEFFRDDDGQLTGAEQFIQAYTGTLEYRFAPRRHRLVGTLEVRLDRSTGDEGGFYEGPNDLLVPNQNLVLAGVLWSLDP